VRVIHSTLYKAFASSGFVQQIMYTYASGVNIFVIMTLYGRCLHNTVMKSYRYRILKAICKSQNGVKAIQFVSRADNPALQMLQFRKLGVCCKSPDGPGKVITDIRSALNVRLSLCTQQR
jgi:hypothetical protein